MDSGTSRSRSRRRALWLAAALGAALAPAAGRAAEASPERTGTTAPAPAQAGAMPPVQADTAPSALLARAEALLRDGDPRGAFALLAPLEARHAGDPPFDRLLGAAALESGQPTRAVFALERVVAARPDDAAARAELGRAYLASGDAAAAREQLRLARGAAMAPDVERTLDRVLGALDVLDTADGARRGTQVRGYLEAGLGHDSNLNSATGNGQFALPAFGGIVFTLDPASQQRGGAFLGLGGGVEVQTPLTGPWSLVARAAGRRALNDGNRDLEQGLASVSAGVAWNGPVDAVVAQLQSASVWLGGSRYRSADGVSAQWQHTASETAQWNVFGEWSRLTYPDQSLRDADRGVLGIGFAKAFRATAPDAAAADADANAGAPVPLVYGSVYLASEKTRQPDAEPYAHHAWGARAGVEWAFGRQTLFATLQFEARRYGDVDPFFETTRHDRQADALAGWRFRLAPDWTATAQFAHTRAASNVAIYDYRRNVVQLLLRRDFH